MSFLLHQGIALKYVYEHVFTSDSGMRRNVPKVLVVVTDGRSQDDVKKSAEKLQHSGANGKSSCSFIVWFLLNIVFIPHTKFPQPIFMADLINSFN